MLRYWLVTGLHTSANACSAAQRGTLLTWLIEEQCNTLKSLQHQALKFALAKPLTWANTGLILECEAVALMDNQPCHLSTGEPDANERPSQCAGCQRQATEVTPASSN